jgi:hypothetical protein
MSENISFKSFWRHKIHCFFSLSNWWIKEEMKLAWRLNFSVWKTKEKNRLFLATFSSHFKMQNNKNFLISDRLCDYCFINIFNFFSYINRLSGFKQPTADYSSKILLACFHCNENNLFIESADHLPNKMSVLT